jgi:hypothetical protein
MKLYMTTAMPTTMSSTTPAASIDVDDLRRRAMAKLFVVSILEATARVPNFREP